MVSKAFLLLTLTLAVTSSPLQPRQDASASSAPKPKGRPQPKGSPKGTAGDAGETGVSNPTPKAGGSPKGMGGSGGFGGMLSGASGSTASPSSGGASGGSSGGLGALSGLLSNVGGMSSSDIKGKGEFPCKKAALIFARGTGEPGNMGYVVGPPLATQLKKALGGDILIQGADYSTDFSGSGAREMVTLTKQVIQKCPDTKVILGGYSQGAMQVHQALGSLGGDASKVAVAVTFGDPYSTMGWGSGGIVGAVMGLGGSGSPKGSTSGSPKGSTSGSPKASTSGAAGGTPATSGGGSFNPTNGIIFCSTGDFVCGLVTSFGSSAPKTAGSGGGVQSGGGGMGGHLSYSSDGSIPKAVQFILSKVGGAQQA